MKVKTIIDDQFSSTRREYHKLNILLKKDMSLLITLRVHNSESLRNVIQNTAVNMGYSRDLVTFEFI
jgi:hypothetical protein